MPHTQSVHAQSCVGVYIGEVLVAGTVHVQLMGNIYS